MNIYVITRFDLKDSIQLPPLGAATTMKDAVYLLYKELNKNQKEECYHFRDIEETLDIIEDSINYRIFKTDLDITTIKETAWTQDTF